MRIKLTDSPDLKEPLAEQVRDFLAPFTGPWTFELAPGNVAQGTYYNDAEFNTNKTKNFPNYSTSQPEKESKIERWPDIFERGLELRKAQKIPEKDFVLLYTSERNEYNWFGMFDPKTRNPVGFVQGSYWGEYVRSESIYPIIYLTVAIPLRWRTFRTAKNLQEAFHMKPLGCINDFCEEKREIILKLQTGNICQSCYDKAIAAGLSVAELDQIDTILDAIRLRFREFNLRRNKREPSPITIAKEGRKIYIGDSELGLRPLDKALYLFFLYAKQDYRTIDLANHEHTLLAYYRPLFRGSENEEMIRNAGRLARNEDGLANQAVSRINREIEKLIIPELADKYKIITANDGYKKVEMRIK